MDDLARAEVGDLALRALDKIEQDYGTEAELIGATLLFEVRVIERDDDAYHVNFESLPGMSPHHAGGIAQGLAHFLLTPEQSEP